MNTKYLWVVLIGVLIFVGLFFVLYSHFPDSYSGTILLENKEYEAFKVLLLEDEVTISKLSTLSSDGTLIDFKVEVEVGFDFPYGQKDTLGKGGMCAFLSALCTGILLLVGAGLYSMRRCKEKGEKNGN